MVNSNANALGILFPNSYDSLVPDLVSERLMASSPFASRYRLVDFILSSMANCGIDNISLIVRRNYHSLMDHLGSGREWDLTRKNGGLNLVPPYAEKTVSIYNGRVEALAGILDFLKEQKEKYVVMADTNLAVNFDFNALIEAHMAMLPWLTRRNLFPLTSSNTVTSEKASTIPWPLTTAVLPRCT